MSPLYEYVCPDCALEFDTFIRYIPREPLPASCPSCGKEAEFRISESNFSMGWRVDIENVEPRHKDQLIKDM